VRRVTFILLTLVLTIVGTRASAEAWQKGEFQSDSKPVTEYHCVPSSPGPHPAVILLHGGAPQGSDENNFEDMCDYLAEHGYFTVFIEYYSQTGGMGPISHQVSSNFPIFEKEIESGIAALEKNPAVDAKRVAMIGFSAGANLSLAIGAQEPNRVAAIVEYYGMLAPDLEPAARNLPPTLILHGDADMVVPVSNAHKLDALMTGANRPHEMHLYPGLGHGFNFSDSLNSDEWDRTVRFLNEQLNASK
jgi:carboxymethylenebutenolidase